MASQGISVPVAFLADGDIDSDLAAQLKTAALGALDGISGIDPETVAERAVAEVIAAGPLSDLLGDASLERIFFNGPGQAWVTRGGETTQHGSRFSSPTAMVACARRVLKGRGVAVEPGASFAHGHFQDGRRFHVAFGSVGGPFITVERVDNAEITLESLVSQDVLSEDMATYLSHAMSLGRVIVVASNDIEARFEFIGALVDALDPGLRVVAIESGARLSLKNPQAVLLTGGASRSEILRNALKMCLTDLSSPTLGD